jgi:hypothetical protein
MVAVNPLRGEASLDGGVRGPLKLCFDANAFCYAEERLGKSTDEIVEMVSMEFASWDKKALAAGATPKINANLTRALLWAGLQRHHPGIHLAEAGEIMSDAGLAHTVGALLSGFFAAFGNAEGEQGSRPQQGIEPTGSG